MEDYDIQNTAQDNKLNIGPSNLSIKLGDILTQKVECCKKSMSVGIAEDFLNNVSHCLINIKIIQPEHKFMKITRKNDVIPELHVKNQKFDRIRNSNKSIKRIFHHHYS